MTKEALQARVRDLATRAEVIISKAESEGRTLTDAERSTVDGALAGIADCKAQLQVHELTRVGNGADLLAQWRAAGFEPGVRKASIPFWNMKTATFPGDLDRLDPDRRSGVPLGFDQRFIYELFRRENIDATTTSIEIVRQNVRTLASSDSMIRCIDSDGTKPETATGAELFTLPVKQVATVETSVPNVFVQNSSFASFIQTDLRLAYERALDWHVAKALVDANLVLASEATFAETVLAAAEQMLADGYNPSTVIVNPTAWRKWVTLRATDQYVNNDNPLRGFRFVVSNSYYAADGLLIDPAAVGRLYVSPVSLQTFEENAGSTNSSTVRIESNAAFAVERSTAAIELNLP